MTRYACGSCSAKYDRQYAPTYISAAETSYPVCVPKTCIQCKEISTCIEICLACAVEHNQCQSCRKTLLGVAKSLLENIAQLRTRFCLSLAKHELVFAAAISGFKSEIDSYLGGDAESISLSNKIKYKAAQKEREYCLRADRAIFESMVEHIFALERLRCRNVSNISQAVSRSNFFSAEKMPPQTETPFSLYVISCLSEQERQFMEKVSRDSYNTGRQIYTQMKNARVNTDKAD